ncbi:MAG: 50S ribosomal protein L15 [Myxococcota bacterium]
MGTTLHTLRPPKGAKHRRKRVGRGVGSGHGKTSGRGYKGQGSRSGPGIRPGFEGGQMPLVRRMPKRGFHNPFRTVFAVVNVGDLGKMFAAGAKIDPQALRERKLVRLRVAPVKVLANGDLPHALHVAAHRFSKSARAKIEAAGGTVSELKI